jgi:hypothetical protein
MFYSSSVNSLNYQCSTTKNAVYKEEVMNITKQIANSTVQLVKHALKSSKSPFDKVQTKHVIDSTKNVQDIISRLIKVSVEHNKVIYSPHVIPHNSLTGQRG